MSKWRLDLGQIEVVDDDIADILRQKTPAQRLAAGFAANRTARLVIENALRFQHPDWGDVAIRRELARRMTRGTI